MREVEVEAVMAAGKGMAEKATTQTEVILGVHTVEEVVQSVPITIHKAIVDHHPTTALVIVVIDTVEV